VAGLEKPLSVETVPTRDADDPWDDDRANTLLTG
jgi:hypothetical protein